jgi:hypothetical protein
MKKYICIAGLLALSSLVKAQTFWTEQTKLKGSVGKYDIFMTLAIPVGGATPCFTIGEYHYMSTKKTIDLCSGDDERLIERVNNKATGYFMLNDWNKRIGQTVTGIWSSMDGRKTHPVTLKVVGKGDY